MSDVTRILSAIELGDASAAEELLPLVYEELRKLAAAKLAQEKPGQTLQATALVHEAYMKLVTADEQRHWNNRTHFFASAAEAMRRILVDRARQKQSTKRGGKFRRVDLIDDAVSAPQDSDEVLAVDEALVRLAVIEPRTAELVKLRYFAGLSIADAAETLNIPPRSADRLWAFARAWLRREIELNDGSS
jgi:RNA polymerase sigma factor (TIGR02999 family)